MNVCYLSVQFSWELSFSPENRACIEKRLHWFIEQWKVPGWSVTRQATATYFSQWVLMKSCEGIPGCQVSVQNSDSEVCHYRNTSSLFFPPHGAKQKHHTLVSNFIYPITIAHVYTIKSVWLPESHMWLQETKREFLCVLSSAKEGKHPGARGTPTSP